MKNKFLKILEKPKAVIPMAFFIAIIVGFFVYKFVGYAPKEALNNSDILLGTSNLKSGETVDLAFPKTGRVNNVSVKNGDHVKKGQILASLDFADVKGALEIAKANYQKILNGATGPDVDAARAIVQIAQVNLDTVTKQQSTAVEAAHRNLLSIAPEAVPSVKVDNYVAPIITGNYILDKEGDINISISYTNGNSNFFASGIIGDVNGTVNSTTSQPIGNSGLFIKIPTNISTNISTWIISIPNKNASNYISSYNAYQSALESQKRLIATAEASLEQANATLALKVAKARPEDVAAAEGALKVAGAAYDNNFIYAPEDGIINVVNIAKGETVLANQRVISMTTNINN